MNKFESIFKVIENQNCPLYEGDDEFRLSGMVLTVPSDKKTCVTLVEDMRDILVLDKSLDESLADSPSGNFFDCSGCAGKIRLEYGKADISAIRKRDNELTATAKLLGHFSIFQALDERSIKDIVSSLKLKKFPKGTPIIKKGDPGVKLFIIVSGKVEVVGDDGMTITFLEKGEVFGEMSLLSGEPVGATIKVVETTRVLFINGKDFRKILNKYPSLQMFFARLLAKRLAQTNIVRSKELSSGMIGTLSDMPPTELVQTLNQNQKTGVLHLQLVGNLSELYFREGGLIRAKHGDIAGVAAFFEVLKEKEGRFKFVPELPPGEESSPELGDFMWLLMEGLNKVDEGR